MHSRQPLPGARGTREAVPLCREGARVVAAVISEIRLKELVDVEPSLDLAAVTTDIASEQDVGEASNINGAIIARAAAGPPSEKGAGAGYWQVKSG